MPTFQGEAKSVKFQLEGSIPSGGTIKELFEILDNEEKVLQL